MSELLVAMLFALVLLNVRAIWRVAHRIRSARITGGSIIAVQKPPTKRCDTYPQQRRLAPLFRAGQSQR